MQLTAKRKLRGAALREVSVESEPGRGVLDEALALIPVGWAVVRDCGLAPGRAGEPPASMAAALLHRLFGVVLLEFEPADTPDAPERFERRLGPA